MAHRTLPPRGVELDDDAQLLLAEAARLNDQVDETLAARHAAKAAGGVEYKLALDRHRRAMQELADFRAYWRAIGEAAGVRSGVRVEHNDGSV